MRMRVRLRGLVDGPGREPGGRWSWRREWSLAAGRARHARLPHALDAREVAAGVLHAACGRCLSLSRVAVAAWRSLPGRRCPKAEVAASERPTAAERPSEPTGEAGEPAASAWVFFPLGGILARARRHTSWAVRLSPAVFLDDQRLLRREPARAAHATRKSTSAERSPGAGRQTDARAQSFHGAELPWRAMLAAQLRLGLNLRADSTRYFQPLYTRPGYCPQLKLPPVHTRVNSTPLLLRSVAAGETPGALDQAVSFVPDFAVRQRKRVLRNFNEPSSTLPNTSQKRCYFICCAANHDWCRTWLGTPASAGSRARPRPRHLSTP